ncbi:PREDICTED: RRP15-like protein isoform X2 [Acromyrmex echinatior]|uniref:RRP15-like protein isoform X1 n=1 Tax=Acromyrmex echinatior TaxID=103372 RepID=UPI000580CC2E|nr:PREDICTED: RRP15-like protein isoform X1 [Acromyrmex echinatior]XP_011052469.1 PREDICTED: RRP15-like protein isoform X2 [Acromyrmex echinatior]
MQSKTDKVSNAGMALIQSDNEDDSDYEEKEDESDSKEMEANTDEASYDAGSITNAGWADVMQKILKTNKPKRKKTLVLAKAKKLCDIKIKEKEDIPFEIDGIKEEIKTESDEDIDKTSVTLNTAPTKSRITKNSGIRIKPSITDREHERMLQKIATKGVVQLFNAVRQQQVEIKKKLSQAGPLERKREQVFKNINKNAFLDILMGGSKSIPIDNDVKSENSVMQTDDKNKDHKMWSVLRDNFVMGAKLKDWDKKNVEEEDSSAPEDINSDVD